MHQAIFATTLMLSIAGSAAHGKDDGAKTLQSVRDAVAAAQAGNCKHALGLVAPNAKAVEYLSDTGRALITDLGVACAMSEHENTLAYSYAVGGTKLAEASDYVWRMRLAFELDGKRRDAALVTITAMNQGRGAALNDLPVGWLTQLDNELRDLGDLDGRKRLLSILATPAFQPVDEVPVTDAFRLRYAEVLYDAGDRAKAFSVVGQIDTPSIVMRLAVNPRFRSAVPDDYDTRAAMIAYLARLESIAARHPDSLALMIEIASVQRSLGDPELALTTLRAADPTQPGAPVYADKDDKLNWWWDAVARSHAAAGHYELAVAAMRRGADTEEGGGVNVSQTINLAETHLRFGHAVEALKTLEVFDRIKMPASPYGEMEMRFARGCAAHLANKSDPSGDIGFAGAHGIDHPQALGDLLLCVGNMDGAAAAFIARLDDPKRRAGALLELCICDKPAAAVPDDPVYSRLTILEERADVKDAIARAGGVRKFNVQREDL